MDRRDFLRGGMGAAILAARSADAFAQNPNPPSGQSWDAGQVRHLLPTVSDTRILIKASFAKPLTGAPSLNIGASTIRGGKNDTEGAFWQFYAAGLQPGRRYTLSLLGADGKSLC
ncbi:MAG: alkaline phosphatase D family protein, partial [Bryobacteraceae bacterium]